MGYYGYSCSEGIIIAKFKKINRDMIIIEWKALPERKKKAYKFFSEKVSTGAHNGLLVSKIAIRCSVLANLFADYEWKLVCYFFVFNLLIEENERSLMALVAGLTRMI